MFKALHSQASLYLLHFLSCLVTESFNHSEALLALADLLTVISLLSLSASQLCSSVYGNNASDVVTGSDISDYPSTSTSAQYCGIFCMCDELRVIT